MCRLRPLIWHRFFADHLWIYPCYTLYIQSFGLNESQIGSLMMVWALASMLTGLGCRRLISLFPARSLLLGVQLAKLFGLALWLISPGWLSFATGFACWGMEYTLSSILARSLARQEFGEEPTEFSRFLGRLAFASSLGMASAALCCSLLNPSYTTLLAISLGSLLLGGLALLRLKTAHQDIPEMESKESEIWIPQAIEFSVAPATVVAALIAAIMAALSEFLPLCMIEMDLPGSWVGFAVALLTFAEGLAALVMNRLDAMDPLSTSVLLIGTGLLLLAASLSPEAWFLIFPAFGLAQYVVLNLDFHAQYAAGSDVARVAGIRETIYEAGLLSAFALAGLMLEHFSAQFLILSASLGLLGLVLILVSGMVLNFKPLLWLEDSPLEKIPQDLIAQPALRIVYSWVLPRQRRALVASLPACTMKRHGMWIKSRPD